MLSTEKHYHLENDRAILTPLAQADFDHLLPFALNEADIWKYSLQSAASAPQLREYIYQALMQRSLSNQYPFIIFDKATNNYAGCTRFYDINTINQTASIGYTWYGRQYQGTGLNRQCKALLFKLAFEECNIERIEFRVDAQNERSIRAIQNVGGQLEGRLRNHLPRIQGGRRDTVILSVLKQEWFDDISHRLAV